MVEANYAFVADAAVFRGTIHVDVTHGAPMKIQTLSQKGKLRIRKTSRTDTTGNFIAGAENNKRQPTYRLYGWPRLAQAMMGWIPKARDDVKRKAEYENGKVSSQTRVANRRRCRQKWNNENEKDDH